MASDQHHWLVTVALVTSSLIALIANLLLLLVFCRRRGLRTISNRFTINLLLTNLLSSTLLIPLLIVDQELTEPPSTLPTNVNATKNIIFQEETLEEKGNLIISDLIITTNDSDSLEENNAYPRISSVLCYVAQSIVGLMCTASILSILLIGIDQYFAVIHSLRYHSYIDKFKSLALILTSWIISIVFGVFGALTQNESQIWRFCTKHSNNSDKKPLNSVYALSYFMLVILLPFLAICVIYVCIYAAAHNNSERMRKSKGNSQSNLDYCIGIKSEQKTPSESRLNLQSDVESDSKTNVQQQTLPKVRSAPNFISLVQESCTTNGNDAPNKAVTRTHSDRVGFITHLKCRLSNASVFRYREETRAAKISILVVFMVLICYIPYGIAVVLNSNAIGVPTTPLINLIALVLLILSNILSPFLFAYRNRRIRRELLRFLGFTLSKNPVNSAVRRSIVRPKLVNRIIEEEGERTEPVQPFLLNDQIVPNVVITCKLENEQTEKGSILKRVCSAKNWPSYKKCSFITVPESCWQTESARGSFSSASTQMSVDE